MIAVLSHHLDKNEFGIYMMYASLMPFASVLLQLGIHQVTMRQVAEALERKQKVGVIIWKNLALAAAISFALLMMVLMIGVGLGLFDRLKFTSTPQMIIVCVWAMMCVLQLYLMDTYKSFRMPGRSYFYGENGTIILQLLIIGMLIFAKSVDLYRIMVSTVVASVCIVVLGIIDLKIIISRKECMLSDRESSKRLEVFAGLKIWAAYSLALAYYPIAMWYMGVIANGAEDAGSLAIAYRLSTLVLLPGLIVNSVMPRRVMEYKITGSATAKSQIQSLCMVAVCAALATIPAMMLFGQWLVKIWFGSAFIGVTRWVLLLQIGRIMSVGATTATLILIMYHQENKFVESTVIAMLALAIILVLPLNIANLERVVIALMVAISLQAIWQIYNSTRVIGFFHAWRV